MLPSSSSPSSTDFIKFTGRAGGCKTINRAAACCCCSPSVSTAYRMKGLSFLRPVFRLSSCFLWRKIKKSLFWCKTETQSRQRSLFVSAGGSVASAAGGGYLIQVRDLLLGIRLGSWLFNSSFLSPPPVSFFYSPAVHLFPIMSLIEEKCANIRPFYTSLSFSKHFVITRLKQIRFYLLHHISLKNTS